MAKFSILVNGSPVGLFNISRSLRQGNPLSPLLFVIVMEAISRMISALVINGFMTGFLVGYPNRCTLNISHFLFADNTLTFCEANQNQIRAMRELLLCFEAASCLKVKFDKSELVPVGNVRNI
ncbi:uncharacterized mitochondrial protein AtMg01250-like [Juglans microcarpa x Juglans regia]|uniref:uncharacterized mitochondrial protein AtMg01250-like n=1 Tax=Juglans microcarpa x Juglans regia TaxID=2249226 RepID=UPI001B7DB344|nr:uncharacterized mitochondrial protein AtMg01250-like [Juglans microcarpa x Juglans regia]